MAELRSPIHELRESTKYGTYPTGLLQSMKLEWEGQLGLEGRTPTQQSDIAMLLGRINFELSDPDRDAVVSQLSGTF